MNDDLISRSALMEFPIRRNRCDREHANPHFINGIESVLEYAANLHGTQPKVKHARWGYGCDGGCSACGEAKPCDYFGSSHESDYCPGCGARMDL